MRFADRYFDSIMTFPAETYSKMKFGCDISAQYFGNKLAESFFQTHADMILANKCVVIPSPYNVVPNAATIMTKHFMNEMNNRLVEANGTHLEYSLIHRKVSYVNDYGFLSKEKRKGLIDNDRFYLNTDFLKDKLLLFVDDVRITGTHEEKLLEVMEENKIDNDAVFLYAAQYEGNSPQIEAEINFASIKDHEDYLSILLESRSHVIVRPLKFLLSQDFDALKWVLDELPGSRLFEVYYGCLAEGYYTIPEYQENFQLIKSYVY